MCNMWHISIQTVHISTFLFTLAPSIECFLLYFVFCLSYFSDISKLLTQSAALELQRVWTDARLAQMANKTLKLETWNLCSCRDETSSGERERGIEREREMESLMCACVYKHKANSRSQQWVVINRLQLLLLPERPCCSRGLALRDVDAGMLLCSLEEKQRKTNRTTRFPPSSSSPFPPAGCCLNLTAL